MTTMHATNATKMRWRRGTMRSTIHVLPEGDLLPHDASPRCGCDPACDEDGVVTIYFHQAYDGRTPHEEIEGDDEPEKGWECRIAYHWRRRPWDPEERRQG